MKAMAPLMRVTAIAIAIAGLIDPAFTRSVALKPDVSLVVSGPLPDPALADRVARALEPIATVVRGPSIGAEAVVSVGYQLPSASARTAAGAFAIVPTARSPWVSIESIRAPEHGNLHARVPVVVAVRARAARNRTLAVDLEINGVAIDRVTRTIGSDDEVVNLELGLVASASGRIVPTVAARIDGAPVTARADATVRIGSDRHPVLVFDRRPSWQSSFVRRALESDPRFVVSSRIVTSRNAGVVAGKAPEALSGIDTIDLVIAGAPDVLTMADADGLDAFMRTRGGAVLILMDAPTENPAIDRLTGVTRWVRVNKPEPVGVPLASELQSPAELPRWAEPVAFARTATSNSAPPMWQTAVGRGRLIVSGALDAWRYRDRDNAAFDRFWKLVAADAVATEATGEKPEAAERRMEGTEMNTATPDEQALLRGWTASHHGAVFADSDLSALASAVAHSLAAPFEPATVHPMRSGWWIVPFAALLGIEWWQRRKNGQR